VNFDWTDEQRMLRESVERFGLSIIFQALAEAYWRTVSQAAGCGGR